VDKLSHVVIIPPKSWPHDAICPGNSLSINLHLDNGIIEILLMMMGLLCS